MSQSRSDLLPPRWVIFSALFVGFLWLLVELKELVILLVVSYAIAYALHPFVSWIERKGLPRVLAVFAVFGIILSIIALLLVTAVPTILDEYERLSHNLDRYLEIGRERLQPWLESVKGMLPKDLHSIAGISESIDQSPWIKNYMNGETLAQVLTGLGAFLMRGYNLTLTVINVVILPFLVYYLLVDFRTINQMPLSLIPITKRNRVAAIFSEIDGFVSAFARGQITVCFILFVLYAIGLGALGVELWFLLAAISGFGNLIPYLGLISGLLLSSLMALVTFGDVSHVLMVLGVYGAVQALESTLITPKILGDSVGLSPLAIILALVAGGQLFGLLGVFLAVPGAAVLRVLFRHLRQWMVQGA
jgi:predicted PurR-regulated permease PerM